VVERFFGTVKCEHLYRAIIADGDALDMEIHRFRIIDNTIRPHHALDNPDTHRRLHRRLNSGEPVDERLCGRSRSQLLQTVRATRTGNP
jgi:hypothetical protein